VINKPPITPPPELVQQWSIEAEQNHQPTVAYSMVTALATRAAQWGADQELEETWLETKEPCYAYYCQRSITRRQLLAIAAELETPATENQ
jgi:hypothetical protein